MTKTLSARRATPADLDDLTAMNRHLIEDEGSRNPMSLAELKERMAGWLAGDEWQIVVLQGVEGPLGYATFRVQADSVNPRFLAVYLRQFFIRCEVRSQGYGVQALRLLAADYFPQGAEVAVDVLATNPRGEAFWHRAGFQPYALTMKWQPSS